MKFSLLILILVEAPKGPCSCLFLGGRLSLYVCYGCVSVKHQCVSIRVQPQTTNFKLTNRSQGEICHRHSLSAPVYVHVWGFFWGGVILFRPLTVHFMSSSAAGFQRR